MGKSYKELMNSVTTFVFDVDGVLTDGSVQITSSGELLRTTNCRDGYAIKTAIDAGYAVCVISGAKNDAIRLWLRALGVTDIHFGTSDKVEVLKEYAELYAIDFDQILYMGNDIPDLYAMKLVGLASCPQDAAPEIKAISNYISHRDGGRGAVRDAIEQVLKVHGKWLRNFDATIE